MKAEVSISNANVSSHGNERAIVIVQKGKKLKSHLFYAGRKTKLRN